MRQSMLSVLRDVEKTFMTGLVANFNGECSEVGMYPAMSRVAEREDIRRSQKLINAMLSRKQSMRLNSAELR